MSLNPDSSPQELGGPHIPVSAMLVNDTARTNTLCATIRAYWLEHGYPAIKAWPETIVTTYNRNSTAVVVIRSNLGPKGYPPKLVGVS